MNNKIAALATTATFGVICNLSNAQSAEAATFTYNLGGERLDRSSFTFTPVGFTEPELTVTAVESGDAPRRRDVRRRPNGLGVIGDDLPGQVDGRNNNFESLRLRFDEEVTLESATFSRVENNDGFRLIVNGNRLVNLTNNLDDNNPFDFSGFSVSERTSDRFRFSVTGQNDDYRLQSVTVSTPVPETSAILPLLGLGLIGLLRYRQSSIS